MAYFNTQYEKLKKSKVKISALFEGSQASTVGPSYKVGIALVKDKKGLFPVHGMKAYRWSRGLAPFSRNLATTRR